MGELSSYTRPARCFEEVAAENKPLSVSLGMGGGRGTGPSPAPHHQLPPPTKAQRSRKIKREDKFELFCCGMGFGKNVRTNVPDLDKSESVETKETHGQMIGAERSGWSQQALGRTETRLHAAAPAKRNNSVHASNSQTARIQNSSTNEKST
jgi:hypothetical protein